VSTYTWTGPAPSQLDAEDIAKRRAREDGYRTVGVDRSHRAVLAGQWTVVLLVERLA
jgi:hypothetical protein